MKYVFFKDGNKNIVNNIFCIGRNYADHIKELDNKKEDNPLVFLKPTSALNADKSTIHLPDFSNEIHYETELVLLIGKAGKKILPQDAYKHIAGFAVGLDLTARDIQNQAKERGLPWTVAKGFDDAATVSQFIPSRQITDVNRCIFTFKLNGEMRQKGNPEMMLFNIPFLISYLSIIFTLDEGDLIYTGTPAGVGKLSHGDRIEIELIDHIRAAYTVD